MSELTHPMRPVTIRMPPEMIEALNRMMEADGRVSAADMARALIYDAMRRLGYLDGPS